MDEIVELILSRESKDQLIGRAENAKHLCQDVVRAAFG